MTTINKLTWPSFLLKIRENSYRWDEDYDEDYSGIVLGNLNILWELYKKGKITVSDLEKPDRLKSALESFKIHRDIQKKPKIVKKTVKDIGLFSKLPEEMIFAIAATLDIDEVVSVCQSNSKLNSMLCDNPKYWRNRIKTEFGIEFNIDNRDEIIYRVLFRMKKEIKDLESKLATKAWSYDRLVSDYMADINWTKRSYGYEEQVATYYPNEGKEAYEPTHGRRDL